MNQRKKKILSLAMIITAFACSIGLIGMPASAKAATVKSGKAAMTVAKTTLYVGDEKNNTTSVKVTYNNKKVTKGIKYKTSNKKVAKVAKGKITALKKGTSVISAKYKGKTCKIKINVKNAKLILKPDKMKLQKGSKYTVSAYANGRKIKAALAKWTSSKPEVASVNSNGVVVGLKTGKTTITATTSYGKAACAVTVWAENQEKAKTCYKVTLDAAGGDCLTNTFYVGKNHTLLKVKLPDASKPGYWFAGWYAKDGNKINIGKPVSENMTLTAKYIDPTAGKRTVTFIAKYNQGPIVYTVTKNSKLGKLPSNPKRKGYKFKGWYTSYVDTNAARITANTVIKNDMMVYAKWEPTKKHAAVKTKYNTKIKAAKYKQMIDAKYVRNVYGDYLSETGDIDEANSDAEVVNYFYKHMMFKGYRPSAWFDPDYYYDYVRSRYGKKLTSYKQVYNFYLGWGSSHYDETSVYSCRHTSTSGYDDSCVSISTTYYWDVYKKKYIDKLLCSCGEVFDRYDDWLNHSFEQETGDHGCAPYKIEEKVFTKKENHSHVDRKLLIYCGSSAKKIATKRVSRIYEPYKE